MLLKNIYIAIIDYWFFNYLRKRISIPCTFSKLNILILNFLFLILNSKTFMCRRSVGIVLWYFIVEIFLAIFILLIYYFIYFESYPSPRIIGDYSCIRLWYLISLYNIRLSGHRLVICMHDIYIRISGNIIVIFNYCFCLKHSIFHAKFLFSWFLNE